MRIERWKSPGWVGAWADAGVGRLMTRLRVSAHRLNRLREFSLIQGTSPEAEAARIILEGLATNCRPRNAGGVGGGGRVDAE